MVERKLAAKALSAVRKEVAKVLTETTCGYCTYDEAEGLVMDHCDTCCKKIVTKLWRKFVVGR